MSMGDRLLTLVSEWPEGDVSELWELLRITATRMTKDIKMIEPWYYSKEDLIQDTVLKFVETRLPKFDASKVTSSRSLITWVFTLMRHCAICCLRSAGGPANRARIKLIKHERKLYAASGRDPTIDELSQASGYSTDRIRQLKALTLHSCELEINESIVETLSINDKNLESLHRNDQIETLLRLFPRKDVQILAMYYRDGLTQREIGEKLGTTKSYINQVIARIKLDLANRKQHLLDMAGDK